MTMMVMMCDNINDGNIINDGDTNASITYNYNNVNVNDMLVFFADQGFCRHLNRSY